VVLVVEYIIDRLLSVKHKLNPSHQPLAGFLEYSSSDEDGISTDIMMEQDARAARSRLQDVGYREGKTALVDANVNAQASFERGVLTGVRMSERAGQVRGLIVALVSISAAHTVDVSANQSVTDSVNIMTELLEQIQLLPNPTIMPPVLMDKCEEVLMQRGVEIS
jgi:hypothetical protein